MAYYGDSTSWTMTPKPRRWWQPCDLPTKAAGCGVGATWPGGHTLVAKRPLDANLLWNRACLAVYGYACKEPRGYESCLASLAGSDDETDEIRSGSGCPGAFQPGGACVPGNDDRRRGEGCQVPGRACA